MSVQTDLLIAEPDHIGDPASSEEWGKDCPRLESSGVDNVVLAGLCRALDLPVSAASLEDSKSIVWRRRIPMVFRLPHDVIDRLARLDASATSEVARRWATQAGSGREGLDEVGVERFVRELSAFSSIAIRTGKPILLAIHAEPYEPEHDLVESKSPTEWSRVSYYGREFEGTCVTGAAHSFLALKLSRGARKPAFALNEIKLSPTQQERTDIEKLCKRVAKGIERANRKLGSSFVVDRGRFSIHSGHTADVLTDLAQLIVRAAHREFSA